MKFVISKKQNNIYYIGDSTENHGNGIEGGCENAQKTLTIPSLIDGYHISEIGKYAFYNCTNIEQLTLEEGYICLYPYAFCFCTNLLQVSLPNSLEILRLGSFENCYKLQQVIITPKSRLKTISEYSFNECYALKSFILPPSLKTVEGNAFSQIKNSIIIFSYYQKENTDVELFLDTPNVTIYVPINGPRLLGNISTQRVIWFGPCIKTNAQEFQPCLNSFFYLIIFFH